VENAGGITVLGKCVITAGCKGKLYKLQRNEDNIRSVFPSAVSGLIDYSPRRVFFEFQQAVASSVWEVKHNLGVAPAVSVYLDDGSGNLNQANPDDFVVNIVDDDNLTITLPFAQKGTIHCVARSSVPRKVKPEPATVASFQVTTSGTITLAIPTKYIETNVSGPSGNIIHELEFTTVRLEVEITKPNEEPVLCVETCEAVLDDVTPWAFWNKVLIRKRRNYLVRTKNISEFLSIGIITANNTLPNGTLIRFLRMEIEGVIALSPIESRYLFFLLSQEPYQSIDKIRNKLIDVGELLNTDDQFFVYRDGELFAKETAIEKTYPKIEKVT